MKIPFVVAEEPLPKEIPIVPQGGLEAPYVAGMGFGQHLEQTAILAGTQARKIQDRIISADRVIKVDTYINKFDKDFQKFVQDYTVDPNTEKDKLGEASAAWAENWQKEALSSIPTDDPLLEPHLKHALNGKITQAFLQAQAAGFKAKLGQLDANYQEQIIEAANRGNLEKMESIAGSAVAGGVWTPERKVKELEKAREIGDKAIVTQLLRSESTEMVQEAIDQLREPGKFTGLNPLEKQLLIGHAKTELRRLENEAKRERKESAATDTYNDIKSLYGTDYDAALTALEKPEYSELLQKKHGVDLTGISAVRHSLQTEKAIRDEKVKRVHDKTAADNFVNLDSLMADSTKGIETIRKQVKDNILDWKVGEHFKNGILNPPDIKSDPAEYISILHDLAMERDKGEITDRILASKKLSANDKKALGNELYREENRETKDWIGTSRKFLESQIIPKFGIMEKIVRTPKEEAAFYNAVKALDEKLEAAKKSGKPIEGRDILTAAEAISPLYKRPIADAIVERSREMGIAGEQIKTKMEREKVIKDKGKKYKTQEDVSKAYQEGKLTWDDAGDILESKFGVKRAAND